MNKTYDGKKIVWLKAQEAYYAKLRKRYIPDIQTVIDEHEEELEELYVEVEEDRDTKEVNFNSYI